MSEHVLRGQLNKRDGFYMIRPWKQHVLMSDYEHVKLICAPLKHIQIDGFFFMRIFPDGTFVDLSTNLLWAERYLANYYLEKYSKQSISDHVFMQQNISIWSMNSESEVWQEGFKYFGIKDGVSITVPQSNWRDVFCFYVEKNNAIVTADLINLLDVLKKFSEYFLEKAEKIIASGCKNRLIIPQKYCITFPEKKDCFKLASLKLFNQLSDKVNEINYAGFQKLSARESDCIRYAAQGYNGDVIGEKLCLSKRTVESYVLSARDKTGCKNLTELVSQYYYVKYLL